MHPLDAQVSPLMREIAASVIVPRFRTLAAADISEKTPGDYVTIADRESEDRLTAALPALLKGSRVIGEEACAADPALLDAVGTGRVWLVDPLDGTGNFAEGREPFAMMIALVEDGVVEAGWVLDPLSGRMCHAARGGGAYVDGRRVHARPTGTTPPVAALAARYLPADVRTDMMERARGRFTDDEPPGCAGEQYARVALGRDDVALYWRTLPWDHAPGALFLAEAGGRVAKLDGASYRVADRSFGLLAAASPTLWDEACMILTGGTP